MVIIRFADESGKRRALGILPGRYSFRSWATGAMMAPPGALASLALQGIACEVQGPATYEQRAT